MGLDGSEQRLCEYRCLPVFDDMNNWVADQPTPPKYIQAISEIYQQGPGDDVYANNPVNYVKLDELPGPDNWKPIVDAMKRGDYFVTSGEVLIPNYAVQGSGSQRDHCRRRGMDVSSRVRRSSVGRWAKTERQVISATDLPAFGQSPVQHSVRRDGQEVGALRCVGLRRKRRARSADQADDDRNRLETELTRARTASDREGYELENVTSRLPPCVGAARRSLEGGVAARAARSEHEYRPAVVPGERRRVFRLSAASLRQTIRHDQRGGDEARSQRADRHFPQVPRRWQPGTWGRITGTPYDDLSREWLAAKFRKIGLQTRQEPLPLPPLWFPQAWSASVTASDGKVVALKTAQPVHDSSPTPPAGMELDAAYVGVGDPADFIGRDVRGKAVFILTIPEPGVLIYSARLNNAVKRAEDNGAAVVFLVIAIPGNLTTQLWPRGTKIPNFSLGQEDGLTVRRMIEQASPDHAPKIHVRLDTKTESLKTASIWGVLPGTTDENILVMSHYDGFFQAAMDNASGVAVMLGLAEYFSKVPKAKRRRSISFVGFSTHHEPNEIWRRWMMTSMKPFLTKTALMVNSEHTSLVEWYQYGESLRKTNGIAARRVAVGGSQALTDILMKDLKLFGVRTYADIDLHPAGEIRTMFELAPGFQTIRDGVYYHSDEDTADIVPAEGMQEVARAYAKVIDDVNQLEIHDLRSPTTSQHR